MTADAARLGAIEIRDYRNLERVALQLPDAGLTLVGDNGQGKTNFLEAVYYFQLLRAARGARDADATRFGAVGFTLRATIGGRAPVDAIVGFERATKRKRVTLDGVVVPRLSDALGMLPAVMVSPADIALIGGEPSNRRHYLDVILALTSRKYLAALQSYRAALKHRNAAIRDLARGGRATESAVAVWEAPLAEHGATMVEERRTWIDDVRERFAELCARIGERGRVELRYEGSVAHEANPADALARLLETRRPSDIRRVATNTGPHRDTIGIAIDGHELRAVGSAGQQRTAAVALRLVEAETYQRRSGRAPVFLMDDPFAELDARRGAAILSVVRDSAVGQTFLAVPKPGDIPAGFSDLARATVAGGVIERAT